MCGGWGGGARAGGQKVRYASGGVEGGGLLWGACTQAHARSHSKHTQSHTHSRAHTHAPQAKLEEERRQAVACREEAQRAARQEREHAAEARRADRSALSWQIEERLKVASSRR